MGRKSWVQPASIFVGDFCQSILTGVHRNLWIKISINSPGITPHKRWMTPLCLQLLKHASLSSQNMTVLHISTAPTITTI